MASAGGGVFGSQKTTFSKETQEMLKVMMQESKLTNLQQRQLQQNLKDGHSLPLHCGPNSSESKRRGVSAGKERREQPAVHGVRGRKTREAILERQGSLDQDGVCDHPPCPRYDSTVEKKRLQNIMSCGGEVEEPKVASRHPVQEDEVEIDRFEEVLGEIEARRQFLSEMESLGQGQKYRSQIETEISQKIRELEIIDRQRCNALAAAVKQST